MLLCLEYSQGGLLSKSVLRTVGQGGLGLVSPLRDQDNRSYVSPSSSSSPSPKYQLYMEKSHTYHAPQFYR
jgi:hypothetical protein